MAGVYSSALLFVLRKLNFQARLVAAEFKEMSGEEKKTYDDLVRCWG